MKKSQLSEIVELRELLSREHSSLPDGFMARLELIITELEQRGEHQADSTIDELRKLQEELKVKTKLLEVEQQSIFEAMQQLSLKQQVNKVYRPR